MALQLWSRPSGSLDHCGGGEQQTKIANQQKQAIDKFLILKTCLHKLSWAEIG